jgi:hypothetical protein
MKLFFLETLEITGDFKNVFEDLVRVKFVLFRFFLHLRNLELFFSKSVNISVFRKLNPLILVCLKLPKLGYCFKFKNFPQNMKNSDLINLCHLFIDYPYKYYLNRDYSLVSFVLNNTFAIFRCFLRVFLSKNSPF